MAEVYRARDTRLGRDVALKVVADVLGNDAELLARIKREAKLAGSINHPNVIAVYDVGLHGDSPYFVTELLQGETLRERLEKGALPLATALEWAVQMAQGLAAAHERDVIHRDLKPANVFLTKDGHVKLLDFGIAKFAKARRAPVVAGRDAPIDQTTSPLGRITGSGIVLGTPGYMSPEQVAGDAVDARTDFFSLGALLYEMLTGRRAFATASAVETGYAILHSEPEPLPETIPQPVAQAVHRCLEKDRARRFQSARDLAFHLETLRTPTGSSAASAASSRLAAQIRRGRWWLFPIFTVLAVGTISGATYLITRARELPIPSVERMTFRRGTVWAGRFTPDGRVVYSAAWGAEREEIFNHAPGGTESQPLGVRAARLLSVSAQGELAVSLHPLGFGNEGAGGTLALVPGFGGAPREMTDNIISADWSRMGELAVVRWVGGKRQLEYPLGTPLFESTGLIGFPRVSPNGDTVAFWSQPNGAEPNELVLVDRKRVVRHLLEGQLTGLAWAPNGEEVWFTEGATIWASSPKGGRRLVYQGVSDMSLEDISLSGKVLVNVEDARREIAVLPPGHERERELPWLSYSINDLIAISDDGRLVLFSAYPNDRAVTYVRPTDGSSPVKLGPGRALAFSPDEKWVLITTPEDPSALWLLPVGVGVPRKLPVEGLNIGFARWLQDGKRFVALAQPKGETQWRVFVVPLEGGTPTLLSDVPVGPIEVSRDDRFAAGLGVDGIPTLYPLNGGSSIPLPDLGKNSTPVGWTLDGQLWVSDVPRASRDVPRHLFLYDILTRHIVEERTVGPADVTGIATIERICLTPDSRTVAVQYTRVFGGLYVLNGLVPSRP